MVKRILCAFVIVAVMFTLTGCERSEMLTREVENFELIRTMAVDKENGQIKLTASTGIGIDNQPGKIYTTTGATVAEAMENLRRSYTRSEAFFAYTEHILIGQDAYDCLSTVLDLVSRSIDLRMDANIYIVRNSSAQELIQNCQGEQTTASDMLTSVVREVTRVNRGYVYTCLDVISNLATDGCALITSIQTSESKEKSDSAPEYDVLPVGFAIVKEDEVVGFTDQAATAGTVMLNNISNMQTFSLGDITVQVTQTHTKITSDDFKNIKVQVTAHAGVIEASGQVQLTDDSVREQLERKLATKLLQQIKQSLITAQQHGTDFCSIGNALEMQHPTAYRQIDWQQYFTQAKFDITIKANIQRTYDVYDPVQLKGEET